MTDDLKIGSLRCEDIREILSASLDMEATPNELVTAEKHLEQCVHCAAYESELIEMQGLLTAEVFPQCDSDRLWGDVLRGMDQVDNGELSLSANDGNYDLRRWFAGVAVTACMIVSIAVGSLLLTLPQQKLLPVVAETVRDFETFRVRGGLLDVDTNNTAEVVQWMSAKVDFNLPDSLKSPAGYKISGGRLCSFLSRRAAFFHYEKDAEALSLYVMKAAGLKLPDSGQYETSTTGDGLTTVTWARDDLAYVIVSQLPAVEVIEFASRT